MTPRPGTLAYLVLMLRREGPTGDLFRLSHWRQLDPTPAWAPLRGADVVDTLKAIKTHVATLIEQVERDWVRYDVNIRIEFILDRETLNLDVDQWPWENDEFLAEPVGCRYHVVVRSLERMREVKYHRVWHQRWVRLAAQLDVPGPVSLDSTCWGFETAPAGPHALMSALSKRHELVSLVLDAPPRPGTTGGDEIAVAVKAGVPLIVWHRDDCHTHEFTEAVKFLLHDEDDQHHLLERVRLARATAFAETQARRHVCGDLAVLYDDPTRVVLPTRPSPPEEVSVA